MINFTDSFKKKAIVAMVVAIVFSLFWPFLHFDIIICDETVVLNPAEGLPVLFGFMFGSAGAIGCALGTIGPELFKGTLTLGTSGLALGYFCLAYTPYKVWAVILKREDENIFLVKKLGDVVAYIITGMMGSLLCALPQALANDIWYQSEVFSTSYLLSFAGILISVLTFGLILYVVLSAFNMFGLAKSVKKYPIKTMIHIVLVAVFAAMVLVLAIVSFYFVDGGTRNPLIVIPAFVLGLLMLLNLMYGGEKIEIVDKKKTKTMELEEGEETKLLPPPEV